MMTKEKKKQQRRKRKRRRRGNMVQGCSLHSRQLRVAGFARAWVLTRACACVRARARGSSLLQSKPPRDHSIFLDLGGAIAGGPSLAALRSKPPRDHSVFVNLGGSYCR